MTPCRRHGGRYTPERKRVLFGAIKLEKAAEPMLGFSLCVLRFSSSELQNETIYTVFRPFMLRRFLSRSVSSLARC